MSESQKNNRALSRRDALKAIAAATGAVTLASLPKKWEPPVIEVGALPAHAQISTTAIIVVNNTGGSLAIELFNSTAGVTVTTSPTIANGASHTFTNLVAADYTLIGSGPDPCTFPAVLTFTPNFPVLILAAGATITSTATCV